MATRILLVDDSLVVARQLEGILQGDERFEVVGHAKNGAEALTLYASERPDVVFMDIVMPVMDGLQALRALLGVDAGARIIMVSSVGGVGEKASEALRLGACAVVSKPINRDEIIRVLDRVLAEAGGLGVAVKFFGQFLLDRGTVDREQLLAALALQDERNLPLGAYAVKKDYLTAPQAERVNEAQRSMYERFGDLAVEMGLLTEAQVAELVTMQQNDHIRIGEALVELGHLESAALDGEVAAFEADQAPFDTEKVVFPIETPHADFLAVAVDLTRKMLLRIARIKTKIAAVRELETMPSEDLITVSLSFTGAITSEFVLSLSRDNADQVARSLIGSDAEISEEVAFDATRELANIICGSTVGKLAQSGQRVDITPPLDGAPMVRAGDKGVFVPLLVSQGEVELRIANEIIV